MDKIVQTKASVALIDITGVAAVDTQTAQHIIEAVSSSKLLGARVVLTGISAAVAQTIVHLGVEMGDIDTFSSLAAGLKRAIALQNKKQQS